MNWLSRIVWWKCAIWLVLGGAIGAAVVDWLPEPGPGGGKRISAERFVAALAYPDLANGESISNVVVYPTREQIDLVTFDLKAKDGTFAAFIYGKQPLVIPRQMQEFDLVKHPVIQTRSTGILSMFAKPVKPRPLPTYQTIASADEILQQAQSRNSGLQITKAWWVEKKTQYRIAIPAGVVLIGGLCSLLRGIRTAEEAAAVKLMSQPGKIAAPMVAAGPTAADLQRVREMDELLAGKLSAPANGSDGDEVQPSEGGGQNSSAPKPIIQLTGGPLDATAQKAKEDKAYAGEFYPTERVKKGGFSLIELIVAIGIITILISLLMPAVLRARQSADTITCSSNLHNIATGLIMYTQAYQNTFPAAYLYIGQNIFNPALPPTSPSSGYVHWSSYLYGSGSVPLHAFTCPAMTRGGLPPTNTSPDNRNPGQVCPNPNIVDQQAPRLAYTVNEALCPRNKFTTNFQSAVRTYRFVKANEVANASATILATEMIDNGNMISYGESIDGWIASHRPLHGFVGNTGQRDIFHLPIGAGFRETVRGDLDPDPLSNTSSATLLDLVGRNHGVKRGYPDHRLSNFAYVDGHVETKSVYDTLEPFQWGAQFYSIKPNDDLQQ